VKSYSYILNPPPIVSLEDNFSTNVNPLGPPEWVLEYIKENCTNILSYPQLWHQECDKAVATELGVDPECHIAIPGTSQFFSNLPMLFDSSKNQIKKQKWSSFRPTFWEYSLTAKLNGIEFCEFPIDIRKQDGFFNENSFFNFLDKHKPTLLFLCTPNNPTGHFLSPDFVRGLSIRYKDMEIILDLTYSFFEANFCDYITLISKKSKNITAVVSYSKFFCLPGLRIGSVIFSSYKTAERYRKLLGPLRLNIFSERILPRLLRDQQYICHTKNFFCDEWNFFIKKMGEYDLKWIKSVSTTTCFRLFFLETNGNYNRFLDNSSFVAEKLYSIHGIRVCDGRFYGINDAVRIRIGVRKANLKLIEALKSLENLTL
jgi:threonine-phosphate decarboxylase